ncbi:unnamed protein product, partial [Discosporangium mesarthrocarpum]
LKVLYENARYAITETCLALPIFREDLSPSVLMLFTALLFAKAFHWLAQARVEHVEQAGRRSNLTLVRLACLLLILLWADIGMVCAFVGQLMINHPSVLILFAFGGLGLGLGF